MHRAIGGRSRPPLGSSRDAEDAHRTGDVLQLLVAHIDESDVEAPFGILLHAGGDADAAGVGEILQARGHVHAVAEDVAPLHHDVADMDADAELDALVRCDRGIAFGHDALHLDGPTHGGDDALELDQHAVARGLDQAAACSAIFGSTTVADDV